MAILLAVCVSATACTGADDDLGPGSNGPTAPEGSSLAPTTARPTTASPSTTTPPTTLPTIELDVVAAFDQLTVTGASPNDVIVVVGTDGLREERGRGDVVDNGSALLRGVGAGPVHIEVWRDGRAVGKTSPIEIPGTAPPDSSHYRDQEIDAGFGYISTRDQVLLSTFVTLPGPPENGPYPTLVEYSGYSLSNPAADDPTRLLMSTLGFALVQVNVRGTGCSGGSFDAFEPIQGLDGYDVIETVAAQPWSAKVGMYGISYPGIMQLHVAATTPPSLAAIAPLSVIDEVGSVLYPGGIFNDGFGADWTRTVWANARPFGQEWTRRVADAGDVTCRRNQDLRVHNPDLVELVRASPFQSAFTESRSPMVETIDVPVFLAGAWQDEQTGGRFPSLINRFTSAPELRATLYNGLHIDPLGPQVLSGLIEFYGLYVAEDTGGVDLLSRLAAGAALSAVFGEGVIIPDVRFSGLDVDEARTRYEAEPGVRILFEQGATRPNLPVARFEQSFETWPPAEVRPTRLFLSEAGRLRPDPPIGPGRRTFESDAAAGSEVSVQNLASIWTNQPSWSWLPPTSAALFTSDIFEDAVALIGPASADLFLQLFPVADDPSSTDEALDADIEVTLSEVSNDGSETYIQVGWLRLSRRALATTATPLRPVPMLTEDSVALIRPGEIVEARVEILPFAHVLRPGSRLRISIDTPGGSRPQWTFEVIEQETTVSVLTGADHPSSILLPTVPGVEVPDQAPECATLRGQPCRPAESS